MKELVYESHFQKISFSEEDAIFEIEWENTVELEDETYRQEAQNQAQVYEKYNGKGLLIDTSNFVFGIVPETQEWVADFIIPKVNQAGITHVATLVSSDFIAQLSIEQSIDEDDKSLIVHKLFDKKTEAYNWLKVNI